MKKNSLKIIRRSLFAGPCPKEYAVFRGSFCTQFSATHMYVLLTKHPDNRVRYRPCAQSGTHLSQAQLGQQCFFHLFFCSTWGQSPVHVV